MNEESSSLRNTARQAGFLWLLVSITTGFSIGYVRSNLIVSGDAATTAGNIINNEFLFRTAIASTIFSQIFLFFFGLTIYRLFKNVNKTLATVLSTSILLSVGIGVINALNNGGALFVLGQAEYLNAFQPDQRHALMMIFLRLSNSGLGILELFTAIFLISFGLLIIKSGYLPRILGVLLIIGGCWFPINTFTKILIPGFYPAIITQLTMLFSALGAIPTIFWLLIKGINEPPIRSYRVDQVD